MTEREEWRPCFGGDYEVSSLGALRRATAAKGTCVGRLRRPGNRGRGYLSTSVYVNGVHKSFLLHRLVAETFLGPCPAGKEVNHKNGIKSDNRLANLEYVTRSENVLHAIRIGLFRPDASRIPPEKALHRGEANGTAVLTDGLVAEIRRRAAAGESQRALAKAFGVCKASIYYITKRLSWRHVS